MIIGSSQGIGQSPGAVVNELSFEVTDHAKPRDAVDAFAKNAGPIGILVNNTGMQHRTLLEAFPIEMFEKIMRTNVTSVFSVGQAVARHMIARCAGKIMNIASVQTALSRHGIAPYTTSKGAVANLTKGLATDWGPKGIQINAVVPGYFDTPLNAALVADPEFTAWIGKRTPVGRWGNLQELQGACIFLASNASSYVNGQTIFVDGGMTACL